VTTKLLIDLSALQDELVRRQPPRGPALIGWTARRMVTVFATFYFVAFVVPAFLDGDPASAFDLAGRALWGKLGLPLVMAGGFTLWSLHTLRRQASAGAEENAKRIEREWVQLTQRGWPLRMLLWGFAMAGAISLLPGTLLVALSPQDELLKGSRLLTFLAFCGFTLVWAIPVPFVIRWYWCRWARRFIVAA
jgi:hypothetical protein